MFIIIPFTILIAGFVIDFVGYHYHKKNYIKFAFPLFILGICSIVIFTIYGMEEFVPNHYSKYDQVAPLIEWYEIFSSATIWLCIGLFIFHGFLVSSEKISKLAEVFYFLYILLCMYTIISSSIYYEKLQSQKISQPTIEKK